MILADSSVWIALLRNEDSEPVRKLTLFQKFGLVVVGDLIVLEILMGARNDQHADYLLQRLIANPVQTMLNRSLVAEAARNYRRLRTLGVTIRKTPDLIIGSYCIANRLWLLHQDRDFEPMARHLGLRIA